jgi:hypothetical protein
MKRVNSLLQVDWIGRDRVVEVVLRKSSEAMDDALATRGLRLWNAVTGEAVLTTDAFYAVAVSAAPDGNALRRRVTTSGCGCVTVKQLRWRRMCEFTIEP